jgi:hypothetical protein
MDEIVEGGRGKGGSGVGDWEQGFRNGGDRIGWFVILGTIGGEVDRAGVGGSF